jgi:hypothetical protein
MPRGAIVVRPDPYTYAAKRYTYAYARNAVYVYVYGEARPAQGSSSVFQYAASTADRNGSHSR